MSPVAPARVAVIGCGAVGGTLLARLTMAGVSVAGVARGDRLRAMARDGVTFSQGRGPGRQVEVVVSDSLDHPVDLALVATMTRDLEPVLWRTVPALEGAAVVTLQNGMQAARVARRLVPREQVVAGVVMFSSDTPAPGKIRCTRPGAILLGGAAAPREAAARTLARAVSIRETTADEMEGAQQLKVLLNLTHVIPALLGRSHRRTFLDPRMCLLAMRLRREAYRVMTLAGASLCSLPGYPVEVMTRSVERSLRRAALEFALAVRRLPPDFISSQEQSLGRGHPGEVDQINGDVVTLARRLGRSAPLNEQMVALIHRTASSGKFLRRRDLPTGDRAP